MAQSVRPITEGDLAEIGPPGLVLASCIMLLILVGLAGSRVETPLRAVRLASLRPKRWYAAWPVIGGGVRGLVLSCGLLALGLFSLEAIFVGSVENVKLSAQLGPEAVPMWKKAPFTEVFPWMTQLLFVWVFAFLGLAFFLSTVGLRGGINWFLTVGVSILLILLSIGRLATRPPSDTDSLTMFSPIVTIVGHFNSRPFVENGPKFDGTFTGYWIAGLLFIAAGIVSMKLQGLPLFRLRRPGYEFLIEPPAAPPRSGEPSAMDSPESAQGDLEDAEPAAGKPEELPPAAAPSSEPPA